MRVPFIAAWAKPDPANPHQRRLPIAAGALQTQTAAVMDLFPTLLALAEARAPAAHPVDGFRLDRLLSGQTDSTRPESFLMHYPHGPHRTSYWTSFREGPWKVIYHYFPTAVSGGSHYQLFHLGNDPFEQADLAATEPAALRRMMTALSDQLEHHQALYPVSADTRAPQRPKIP
jgi:arylsulfatase A-like enzyme